MNGRNRVLVSLVLGMLSFGCDREKPVASQSESSRNTAGPWDGKKPESDEKSAGFRTDSLFGRDLKPSALRAAAGSLQGKWTEDSLRKEDWPPAFRELEPKRIYRHDVNTVIVLSKDESSEEGIYIVVPWSSYHPENGKGWEFRVIGEDVWRYSRRESWR